MSFLTSSPSLQIHAASANGGCLLNPGWHAWEVRTDRWPAQVCRVWDEWVTACNGYITQTTAWIEYALATDYRQAVLLADISAVGTPQAVAVGFLVAGSWPRRQPHTLHFPAYPTTQSPDLLHSSITACEHAAQQWRCREIKFIGKGQPNAAAVVAPLGYQVRERIEYLIDLTPGEAALWENLKRNHRRNVRHSARDQVRVVTSTSWEAVRTLRVLQEEVLRRHAARGDAFGLRPLEAYAAMHRTLLASGHGRVYLALLEETPLSAALFLNFGRHVISIYSGSQDCGRKVNSDYGMYWQALSDFAREGYTDMHFGSADPSILDPTSPAHGLHEFKIGFGATLRHMVEATKLLAPAVSGRQEHSLESGSDA